MIARRLLAAATPLLLAAVGAFPAGAAESELLRITNLQVAGGEANWRAWNFFRLNWDQVPGPPASPRAVVYRLYDPQGEPVGPPIRDTKTLTAVEGLWVPPTPGPYTVDVWLENADGRAGPAARATLRFDDAAPPRPVPLAPDRWLASHEVATLRIGHPQAPLPVSGIRGYAVSFDAAGSSPCAAEICSGAELDLPGGIDDDRLSLGTLPEGTTVARVVAVSGAGVPSPVASAAFKVDASAPRLSLQGLPGGWSNGPVQLTALATDPLSGMAADGPDGPFTAIAVDDLLPVRAGGDRASTWVLGSGVHTIAFFARDAAANGAEGWGSPPPETATVRIDEEPPRVAFSPSLDPAEPERIEALVDDPLSGPSSTRGSIALRPAGTGARFQPLPTQIAGERLVAHWDSDAYRPGSYEFRATAYDFAGNSAASDKRRGGSRMVLVNPLKAPVRLESELGGGAPARTVPFGRGVRFSGRLASLSGRSLGGLEVEVTESFAAGSRLTSRTTVVRTAPDGSFSTWLPPGPSREVTAAFAGTRTLAHATGRSARLGVLSSVRFQASAATAKVGGAPVLFSGRIAKAGAARVKGLPVELQFRYPGAGWSEFRTVEADARGRFRYAYRFSDDDSRGVRFQFRAHVKGREGWPYEPGTSRPVLLSGR